MKRYSAIVIGGSAGSGPLLEQILTALPNSFPIPVVVVRHTSHTDIDETYMGLLSQRHGIVVKEPEDKEPLISSTVYIAPSGYHLLIEEGGRFAYSVEERVNFCRPAIDLLFASAAATYGERLCGIILSGANSDGAHGLEIIEEHGGDAIIQNPQQAEFPEMPQAALETCPDAEVMTIETLIAFVQNCMEIFEGEL